MLILVLPGSKIHAAFHGNWAHAKFSRLVLCNIFAFFMVLYGYDPYQEETCLWGFRPGLTQTGLYNHKKWLDFKVVILDLGGVVIVLSMQ